MRADKGIFMEYISQIPVFGGFFSYFLAFVTVLGVVVFVHEYGHYLVGRLCGIGAEVFSIGFGPVLWSRTDKRGTKWQIALIPLGGYVKFIGDRNASGGTDEEGIQELSPDELKRSFQAAALYKRALTVVAGPIANFILSAFIFTGLIMYQGVSDNRPIIGSLVDLPYADHKLLVGDEIISIDGAKVSTFGDVLSKIQSSETTDEISLEVLRADEIISITTPHLFPAVVSGVELLSAAEEAGIKAGDIITSIDGNEIYSFNELLDAVQKSRDKTVEIVFWRDGEYVSREITPKVREYQNNDGTFVERVMLGVGITPAFGPAIQKPSIFSAAAMGGKRVYVVLKSSLSAIKHIIIGNLSPRNLQGPVGIARAAKSAADHSLIMFLSLMAIISTGIGMLNLFPIPMLDGGHLMFYVIEAMRGGPLRSKTIHIAISIGLAMVLLLMVFVTYNDLMRL